MTALDELEGSIIAGKYRLDRLIGRGGFSAVFRGEHLAMNRKIAVKVLDPRTDRPVDEDATWTQRFEREARVISQLSHTSTITVYDYGIEHGLHYIVMEFIEGRSLHQELKAYGAMAPARAARVAVEILGSLEEAHHVGILHRDLKPANIMLTHDFKGEERVKVLDFGIAKLTARSHVRDDNVTEEDRFVGTPRYASPEQLLAQNVSASTDIYGVGALLWECLVGEPMPIKSSVWGECVTVHLEGEPLELPPEVGAPAGLKLIVDRAISRHPDDRFTSCTEMLQTLASWQTSGFKRGDTMRPGAFNTKDSGGLRFPGAAHAIDPTADASTLSWEVNREKRAQDGLEEVSAGLARGRQSIDPNVGDDSAEWLGDTSGAPSPRARPTFPETPKAKGTRGASRDPSRTPAKLDFSDAELELGAMPAPADDQDSISSSRPLPPADASRSLPPADASHSVTPRAPIPTSRRHKGPDLAPLVLGVVAVGAALAFGLWYYLDTRGVTPTEAIADTTSLESISGTLDELESTQTSLTDSVAKVLPRSRHSPFSTEGILRVLEASGLERSGKVPLPPHPGPGTLELYTFQGSGHLDVYVFESPDTQSIQDYELEVKTAEHIVHFDDNKTVKLVPRGKFDSKQIDGALSNLMRYRALVSDKKSELK